MFDELAQNPEDAEDYDLEALEHRDGPMRISDNDDDASTLVGRAGGSMAEDAVVFDIGDDEGDDDGADADEEYAPSLGRTSWVNLGERRKGTSRRTAGGAASSVLDDRRHSMAL